MGSCYPMKLRRNMFATGNLLVYHLAALLNANCNYNKSISYYLTDIIYYVVQLKWKLHWVTQIYFLPCPSGPQEIIYMFIYLLGNKNKFKELDGNGKVWEKKLLCSYVNYFISPFSEILVCVRKRERFPVLISEEI